MKKIKNLLQKDWYFQGFNGVPAVLYGPAWSMVRDMPNFLGFGYSACIEYFSHDVCYYLYAWDDLYQVRDELIARFNKDNKYLNFLLKSDAKICKDVLYNYKKLSKVDLSEVSLEQLYKMWTRANTLYSYLLSVSHIVEGFSLTTEDRIRDLINQVFPNDDEAVLLLTTPRCHSFMSTEHYDLCQIARLIKIKKLHNDNVDKILANAGINKKIANHQKKYFWKLNGYTSAKYLDQEYFAKEIKELFTKKINFGKFIRDFENLPNKLKHKDKLLANIKNKELKDLLKISEVIFKIHDRRKEYMTQSITYLEKILQEISARVKVPIKDLHYIRPSELQKLPKIWPELKRRRECSVFVLFRNEEVPVLTGKAAQDFFDQLDKNKNLEKISEIKGNCASRGYAQGVVKICRGEEELNKMQAGDILVACMTQPEFLPAMKKAKAVITDEGGLTCHAAIVSRELGIPCVIGTKIATKVLKDGDMVEVDASRGVVKIF